MVLAVPLLLRYPGSGMSRQRTEILALINVSWRICVSILDHDGVADVGYGEKDFQWTSRFPSDKRWFALLFVRVVCWQRSDAK